MSDFKKYDSDSKYCNWGARLAKDPEVKDFGERQAVRLTFVDTSRNETDSDMWIEATAQDRQASLAKFLKKGDTIGVEGKLSMRKYGDNNEKFAIGIRYAELHVPITLFMELKERGFTPGADKPATTKAAPKPANKRPTVSIPDED